MVVKWGEEEGRYCGGTVHLFAVTVTFIFTFPRPNCVKKSDVQTYRCHNISYLFNGLVPL